MPELAISETGNNLSKENRIPPKREVSQEEVNTILNMVSRWMLYLRVKRATIFENLQVEEAVEKAAVQRALDKLDKEFENKVVRYQHKCTNEFGFNLIVPNSDTNMQVQTWVKDYPNRESIRGSLV